MIHITDQNIRGLPGRMSDSGATDDRYTYDANANVSAIRDHQNWFDHRSMGYDQLDRLVNFAPDWGTSTFTYDPLDNIRTSDVAGRFLSHNIDPATNRLSSLSGSQTIGMQYDANGNLTQRAGNGYRFDIGNRMTEAVGKASRYVYDAEGRRSFIYYADGNVGASAYSQDGKVMFTGGRFGTNYIIHLGGKQIAQHHVTNGTGTPTIRYIHTDGLGSPMLRSDVNGNLISGSRTRYEPYGRIIENGVPEGLELGYTGHINDTETGLTYMQQRYYEPLAGRFLSVDPVVTDANTGSSFNRYDYASNNPYRFTDPDGRSPQCSGGGHFMCHVVEFPTLQGAGSNSKPRPDVLVLPPSAAAGAPGGPPTDNPVTGEEVLRWIDRILVGECGKTVSCGMPPGLGGPTKAAQAALPALQRIHSAETLIKGSARFGTESVRKMSTEDIVKSLKPGNTEPLKVKPDGRVFDGNTRVFELQRRGYDVNTLPRVIVP
jgi:RHS repeat-associated protein